MSDATIDDDTLRDPLGVGLTRYQLRVLLGLLDMSDEIGVRKLTGNVAKTWAAATQNARDCIATAQKAAPSAAVLAAIASRSQGGDA